MTRGLKTCAFLEAIFLGITKIKKREREREFRRILQLLKLFLYALQNDINFTSELKENYKK